MAIGRTTGSSAGGYNRGAEAADLVHFDLTPFLEFLVEGENVLAFHGVNTAGSTAADVRDFLIATCSVTGGHIGAGLGVVELTIALHRAFDTPRDQLVWDVGHQGYPHKVLTGRKDRFRTIRTTGGLNGFALRSESEHDCYGAGHAGTALSAALGMCAARDQKKSRRRRRGLRPSTRRS